MRQRAHQRMVPDEEDLDSGEVSTVPPAGDAMVGARVVLEPVAAHVRWVPIRAACRLVQVAKRACDLTQLVGSSSFPKRRRQAAVAPCLRNRKFGIQSSMTIKKR